MFAEIRRARPKRLFLIADGARAERAGEAERCAAARAVVERVDWDCEVHRDFADENLGCGRRPATGISRVFEQVDRAIVLEDDCVPEPSFFRFCDELLERFSDDERVMQISGHRFLRQTECGRYSYFFSGFPNCGGGWATWRRAWRHYDPELRSWPELRRTSWLVELLGNERAAESWTRIFDRAHQAGGDCDYWDYQWTYSVWTQSGLTATPHAALLSNIGFGEGATHTTSPDDWRSGMPVGSVDFPLRHPAYLIRDHESDRRFYEEVVARELPGRAEGAWRERVKGALPPPLRSGLGKLRRALRSRS